ncbi:hypothetical protein MHF_1374 [Mycoplasma haemofelis Ohio2]|uniref:Uncharacterized protein n=1 Tax=Mycoplasma haemofelis (strain Ohio2) TaxID=859194 RepID=F6FGH2_MYCHI|nr:hypothetical protein MHF_1374 [Mycoplasma haemofelis Ohio2]
MNSFAAKSLMGLGGLSVASGGGFLAWNQGLFSGSTESIRDKLRKSGYKALERGSSDWGKIFEVYKKGENTKKFEKDGITASSTEADHNKLKEQCEKALDLDASKDEIYGKVIKWCVVPRKVEEVLSGVTLLGINENDNNDVNDWKPVLTKYIATKKESKQEYALSGVVLKDPTTGTTNEVENIKELKKGCKSRREKMTYELDFEQSLAEVEGWCTK